MPSDVQITIAKISEKILIASEQDLLAGLAAIWVIDSQGGGLFTKPALQLVSRVRRFIETTVGIPDGFTEDYIRYLFCRYGKMCVETSTPSKLEIIQHAFKSEFNEKFSQDSDVALFRNLVEKLDYNEARFLAGVYDFCNGKCDQLALKPVSPDYYLARSLKAKGEGMYAPMVSTSQAAGLILLMEKSMSQFW